MLDRLFLNHLRAVGETYCEHLVMASGFGFSMIGAGLACLVHALVPGAFITTGSDAISRLYDSMLLSRRRRMSDDNAIRAEDAIE